MLKGFRDFILRGNVIELATAVIIGAAFTNIVTSISEKVINPLIAAIGSAEAPTLLIPLREGNDAATIDFGAVITAVVNFLIVAAIVYFLIILPMNKLNDLRKLGKPEDEVPPSQEDLLAEIRDLLRSSAITPAAPTTQPQAPAEEQPRDPGSAPRH